MTARTTLWQRLDGTGAPLLVARLVLGVQFLRMGLAKVGDPVAFLKLVREYELLPASLPWALNAMALAMPWLEIWLAALLLLGVALRGAALVTLLLLLVFTSAIALRAVGLAESQGLPLCQVAFDCGCGSGVVAACGKLGENAVLMLLCGVALVARRQRLCLRP